MSKKGLRTCCVCHKQYNFCLCNPEDRKKDTLYFAYCSENCRDIYKATSDYENGKISANEAKMQLDKLDLSKIENFGESYKATISKINDSAKVLEKEDETVIQNDMNDSESINRYIKKPKLKKAKDDEVIE